MNFLNKSKLSPVAMEDNFDVTVKTEPLVHVTKHRIKNNSRKISVPSRSHLKRNSVGQTWEEQTKNWSVEGADSGMEATSKKLKLPPPPVPKKPKVSLHSLGKKPSENDPNTMLQHDGKNKIYTGPPVQKKPVVPPKPSLPQLSSQKPSLPKPLSLNLNVTSTDGNPTRTDSNIVNQSPKSSSENSPTKAGMSFSERLKASSLSRRKEANGPDGYPGKLRSHIISPVRRGSRSFMNTETTLRKDSDEKPKPAPPVFKRYSSESSTKSILDKIEDDDFDLDEFKNLSLENMAPLPINAVLSPDNSFDDDDAISKDSFDSKELNMKFTTDLDNEEDEKILESNFESMKIDTESQADDSNNLPEVPTSSFSSHHTNIVHDTKEDSSSLEFSSDAKYNTMKTLSAMDINKVLQLPEKPEENSSQQKETFSVEDLAPLQDLSVVKDNPNKPKHSVVTTKIEYPDTKTHSSSIFTSPKRFVFGAKDGSNARRKFRPVGMSESENSNSFEKLSGYIASNTNEKKESDKIDFENNKQKNKSYIDDKDSAELDSSLEHVTPDVTLDSTFEITPTSSIYDFNDKVLSADKPSSGFLNYIKKDSNTMTDESANEIDSNKLPSYEETIIPAQATDTHSSFDHVDFFNDADLRKELSQEPNPVGENFDSLMEEGDISVDTVPSLDVEMLPIVPPPPITDTTQDSDDDMAFNIIDPPTVYDNGDDDNDDDLMDLIPDFNLPEIPNDHMTTNDDLQDETLPKNFNMMQRSHQELLPKKMDDRIEAFDETDLPKNFRLDGIEKGISPTIGIPAIAKLPDGTPTDSNKAPLSFAAKEDSHNDKIESFASDSEDEDIPPPAAPMFDTDTLSPPPVPDFDSESSYSDNEINLAEETRIAELELSVVIGSDHDSEIESPKQESPSYLDNISDMGKERRRSFSDRNVPPVIFDSYRETNFEKRTFGGMDVSDSTENDVAFNKPEIECQRPASKVSSGKSSPKRKLSKESSERNTRSVTGSFESNPGNPSSEANNVSRHASNSADQIEAIKELSPITKKRGSLFTDDMLGVEPNKLSPWSSFEHLPDSGKPDSRRSSGGSSVGGLEDREIRRLRRLSDDPRWSSFDSNSSDEQGKDKKVNIVKLLRERTMTQDGDIDDPNDVQLDFTDTRKSDIENDYGSENEIKPQEESFQEANDSKFDDMPLGEWTVEDVGDWLEMIGLADLRPQFQEKNIGGRELLAIDLQLLDEMGISNIDDRELILSEIYALKNPEDMDVEMSLLDALDNASGYDREKMLAVLEALQMSSEDQENRYLPASPPLKISLGGAKSLGSEQKSPKSKRAKDTYRRAISEYAASPDNGEIIDARSKSATPRGKEVDRRGFSLDSPISTPKKRKDKKGNKSGKKKSFLREAFSFRRKGSGRIARLFNSRKKLVDSSLKYLLQASPQGIVKIWTNEVQGKEKNVSLLVTSTTTAVDVTKTVLEKLEMIEDVNCYHLVQSHSSKSVPDVLLEDDDCPLVLQCRWPDAERYKFELKKKSDGSVIVVFTEDNTNDERSVTIETTLRTICSEVMSLSLRKLQNNDPVNSYSLYHMRNDRSGKAQTLQESQIPMDANLLKIAPSISKPSVFRLIRVNFLGSPERSLTQHDGQKSKIDRLEEELKETKLQLEETEKTNCEKEKELQKIMENNFELKKRVVNQDEQILHFQELANSLKIELEQKKSGTSAEQLLMNGDVGEKFEMKQREIEMLRHKIEEADVKSRMQDEELKKLKNLQNENDGLQVEVQELSKKLFDAEETRKENEILNHKLASLEEDLEDHYDKSLQNEEHLQEQNEQLQSTIDQLKLQLYSPAMKNNEEELHEEECKHLEGKIKELETSLESKDTSIASLRRFENENEVLKEQVKTLENLMARKDNTLESMNELSVTNEELRDQVKSLERIIKQKDGIIANASDSQKEILELRRKAELLSEEIAEKTRELEESQSQNIAMRDILIDENDSKDRTIEKMTIEIAELRRQLSQFDKDKKEMKIKLKDIQQSSMEKKRQIDELNELHEEYKGQHQRIKKLERELTLRSDELQQIHQEKEASTEELRNHAETLEQNLLGKDSKIIDLEFKMQKLERRLRETEDLHDDEIREKNRLTLAYEDISQKSKELNKRVDDFRKLVAEKDKIIQTLKGSQTRTDEKIRKELTAAQRTLLEKEATVAKLKDQIEEERTEMRGQLQGLQEVISVKETKWKEKDARINREKEEQRSRYAQLESKFTEKDAAARRLEAKVAKLETMARENMRKFEKFMSDKDRMLRQVREESEKDIKDLKEKIRRMGDDLNQKEKHVLQLNRSGSIDKEFEVKLKQKEEENKQHKFLLERLMSVVNDKDPRLLEEFENSFSESTKGKSDKQPLISKIDEDWC